MNQLGLGLLLQFIFTSRLLLFYTAYMRLILQPKTTKKDVATYSQLLKEILQIRILYLYRLYLLSALALAAVSRKLAVVYFFICAITSLERKICMHTMPITATSRACALKKRLLSWKTALSWLCYAASTLVWFALIARPAQPLFSVQLNAGLQRHAKGLSAAKDVLNHSLVYLNEDLIYCGVMGVYVVTIYTLYYAATEGGLVKPQPRVESPSVSLAEDMPKAYSQLVHILATLGVMPVLYFGLRWLIIAPFYALPMPGYVISATTRPSILGVLVVYPVKWAGLVVVWQAANSLYNAYLFRGPVHAGKTISQKSQDPCATLVTGLQAKRGSFTRLEAWLELLVVDKQYRQSLYSQSWKQIFEAFKDYTTQVKTELEALCPAPTSSTQEIVLKNALSTDKGTIQISSQPVVLGHPSRSQELVQSMQTESSLVDPDKIAQRVKVLATDLLNKALASPYGQPFAKTETAKLASAVPDLKTLEYCIEAVANMAVHSVQEDEFGYVQDDVGQVLESMYALQQLSHKLGLESLDTVASRSFERVAATFRPYVEHLKLPDDIKKLI